MFLFTSMSRASGQIFLPPQVAGMASQARARFLVAIFCRVRINPPPPVPARCRNDQASRAA